MGCQQPKITKARISKEKLGKIVVFSQKNNSHKRTPKKKKKTKKEKEDQSKSQCDLFLTNFFFSQQKYWEIFGNIYFLLLKFNLFC
jgi:hypothetical protein